MLRFLPPIFGLAMSVALATSARGDSVSIAVATNFVSTAERLGEMFTTQTGHEVLISHGSSGKLFAQIQNGAPFDVFLSADRERPAGLLQDGTVMAVKTYALGRLVLLVNNRSIAQLSNLLEVDATLAIANPRTAPYGQAAKEVLIKVRDIDRWDQGLVYGENVGQTFGFAATGNAQMALVALSQVVPPQNLDFTAATFEIPQEYYSPIYQDAALIHDTIGARAFYDFLTADDARALIKTSGYGLFE